jgi:hypothetical protein
MNEQEAHTEQVPVPPPRTIARSKQSRAENKEVPANLSKLERHSRRCQVCNHPEREAIEELFIQWIRPTFIAGLYEIPWVSLYRHARALNLFAERKNQVRSILENIMERGVETDITGDTVIRAVKAYTCLTDDNHWVEPASTSHVVFSAERISEKRPSLSAPVPAALPEAPPSVDLLGEGLAFHQSPITTHQSPLLIDTPND